MKKKLAIWVLNWLNKSSNWKVGDRFTVVNWINTSDRSWVGEICEITDMKSNLIMFKQITPSGERYINNRWFIIGQDFNIRPL